MNNSKTVAQMSGFNFIKNPFQKETTIFECFDGIFICETPEPDDRHKQMNVLREATNAESEYHNSKTIKLFGTTWKVKTD